MSPTRRVPARSAGGARRTASASGGGERGGSGGVHVGVLRRRGRFLVAEPFFEAGPRLAVSRDGRAGPGDLVAVTSRPHGGGRGGRAVITARLGRPEIARDVIEAFMVDRGLKRSFSAAVEREAVALADIAGESDRRARRDLRSLPTFTIDPATARDFDDAISAATADGDGWRVCVHIADVGAYVSAGSLLDREAYRRGCSVYVPGAVEPMLPPALSSGACSLLPGQDRLAVTADLVVGRDASVQTAAFYPSLIRSDARLDYDQVDRIFAGTEPAGEPWAEPLGAAREAAAALQRRRSQRGGLVISSQEPEFGFDREGNVIEAAAVEQTEAHRLIEHLMIAANEEVAKLLSERGIPALYRVHERPDGLAVERLVEQLASLGVPTPPMPKGPLSPQQAAAMVGEVSQVLTAFTARAGRGQRALASLVLRSLKQAYYDHRNLGHAGLQSSNYCHFTSPIRRYPDLVCHRAVLAAVAGQPAPDSRWVAATGPWASAREREAMTIERDADDIALGFLLERLLGDVGLQTVFEGEVTGLHSSGAFVAFGPGGQFEGMLPVRRLVGDWWERNELGTILHGARTGRTIRLGDPIEIQVGTIDAPRGRVDLHPVVP